MAPRILLGCLVVVAWAVGASSCKGKGDAAKTEANAIELDKRCEQMAKVCGDKAKHVEKILEECRQAAKTQVETGCADKAIAVYDCYVKDLCGDGDKVWAIDDVRVLADRHGRCQAEQTASRACGTKN